MRFQVFGRTMDIQRMNHRWQVYLLGQDGKRRLLHEVLIPSHVPDHELETYLEDLLHEWASPGKDQVIKLE
ncbi:MAG: hypothetical protein MI747_12215 [Desulfobacterales bacterium]|nr:hypothetical protein [Desulfobacterales bacterium]